MNNFQINKEIVKIKFEMDALLIYYSNYFNILTEEQVDNIYRKMDKYEKKLETLKQLKRELKKM